MIELTFNELEIISESLYAKWERLKETEHQIYSYAIRGLINKITKETNALWDAKPSKIEPSNPQPKVTIKLNKLGRVVGPDGQDVPNAHELNLHPSCSVGSFMQAGNWVWFQHCPGCGKKNNFPKSE